MVFKLVEGAQKSWRRLDGHNQLPKLVLGVTFNDGIEVNRQADRPSAQNRRRLTGPGRQQNLAIARETYNVGGRNERRNIDVVRQICAHLDELRPSEKSYERLITDVADQPGLDQRYAIDAAKLETELGWRAQETFETGIKKTVRWYLDRADWWRPLRNNPCPGNRLGASA
jgi:hypothetical protein